MKKKPPRGRKKPTRSERKQRSRSTRAPVAVQERPSPVLAEHREEACYIRFGLPPKEGGSANAFFQSEEAGVSAFRGRKLISARNGKSATSYAVEIEDPDEGGGVTDAILQTQSLLGVVVDNRPVLALTGGQVVGVGGDGEPVVQGCVTEHISPLAQIRLPEWWGSEGRDFERLWNHVRRTPKLRTSPAGRAAAQQKLLPASQRLMGELHATLCRTIAWGGASKEDEEKLLALNERVVSTDKKPLASFASKKQREKGALAREANKQFFRQMANGEGVSVG